MHKLVCMCVCMCARVGVCVCEAIWVNAAYLFSDYVTWQARKLLNKSLGKSPEREMKTREMCPKASARELNILEIPVEFSLFVFLASHLRRFGLTLLKNYKIYL